MQRKIICSVLVFVMIFSVFAVSREKAFADPFTASQIASVSYAMFNSWGISFTAGSATAQGMSNFMAKEVQNYVNSRGGSIADVFVGKIAVDAAGKLVVAHQMYNCILGFVGWLKNKFGLDDNETTINEGTYNGQSMGGYSTYSGTGLGCTFATYREPSTTYPFSGYGHVDFMNDGNVVSYSNVAYSMGFFGEYFLDYQNLSVIGRAPYISRKTGAVISEVTHEFANNVESLDNSLKWSVPENWSMPTVLNPDKEWTGTIGGYSEPDTNLDQLLGDIDQAVADNNLVVDGEVIDIPVPTPTPVPIDPDTPLQDVPWEGLDNNLQQLYEQGLEEIGTIGEARDAITDAVGEQTGALEDAIADNAGVVSGAIDQAVSDVQTAIGEQTAALDETLSATAEGVETIAEAIEDEEINWRKFDLRGLFPFCIPFDIYNMLNALDASPTAPHVQIPFVIQSLGFSYLIDLDFSAFDPVAAIMRQMELICYGLALAWATSKVIKW